MSIRAITAQLIDELVDTPIHPKQLFQIEIEGDLEKLSLLCSSSSYTPIEIEYEQIKIGGKTFQIPISTEPVDVTFIFYDTENLENYKAFKKWERETVNPDGTWKPSTKYAKNIKISQIKIAGNKFIKSHTDSYLCGVGTVGEIENSTDGIEAFQFTAVLKAIY